MSVGLIIIATGVTYRDYAARLIYSARTFFPEARPVVFADGLVGVELPYMLIHPKGYPNETLYRYHTMWAARSYLSAFDHLFYIDADMEFVAPVYATDIISDGLTATLHPGFVGSRGTPETRPESMAFCDNNFAYFCGGFQGGETYAYLDAADKMSHWIDQDAHNGITAVWHDESHWNRLLADAPPAKVLSPEYCWPEEQLNPTNAKTVKILALDKRKRGNHPRFQ
jgi:Glycosyltransferase family 6